MCDNQDLEGSPAAGALEYMDTLMISGAWKERCLKCGFPSVCYCMCTFPTPRSQNQSPSRYSASLP